MYVCHNTQCGQSWVTGETGAKNDFQRNLLFSIQFPDYNAVEVSLYSTQQCPL